MPQVASIKNAASAAAFTKAVLDWFDTQGRDLPWRVRLADRGPDGSIDPYPVWLSEVMLQQTTIAHGTRYWQAFCERWPIIADLAAAPREAVLSAWAGLGYYARARNLHACAVEVTQHHAGVFPRDLRGLKSLPGIGDYTARAIRAFAFNAPDGVLDTNVERVLSRVFAIETPLPKSRKALQAIASDLVHPDRSADYNAGLMDIGAIVCTPKAPQCPACPVSDSCKARKVGTPEAFPVKPAKVQKPTRYGRALWLEWADQVCLVTRPDSGLLGGMRALPTTDWVTGNLPDWEAPWPISHRRTLNATVRHTFTHFHLELTVEIARLSKPPDGFPDKSAGFWSIHSLADAGLPSVFAKAAQAAQAAR